MNFVIESSLNKFIIKNMRKIFILFVLVFALAETANSQNLIQSNFTGVMDPSGVYFYTMRTDDYAETKKMILIK